MSIWLLAIAVIGLLAAAAVGDEFERRPHQEARLGRRCQKPGHR